MNLTRRTYVYRMLELASHADIEIEAKILYIIEGIPDDESNKTILYGANNKGTSHPAGAVRDTAQHCAKQNEGQDYWSEMEEEQQGRRGRKDQALL